MHCSVVLSPATLTVVYACVCVDVCTWMWRSLEARSWCWLLSALTLTFERISLTLDLIDSARLAQVHLCLCSQRAWL